MARKLLNKNNLIIVIILIGLFIPTVAFAASVPINEVFKSTVAGWYMLIKNVCLVVMLLALIVLGIKAELSNFAEEKTTFKEIIVDWVVCIIIIVLLEQFIYILIHTNERMVNKCKEWGYDLSGIDASSSEDEYDEVTIYESAMTKAYEIKFTSGTIGMILYAMLVYYTIKFFFVYVKRYINVMVLILLGPIIFTVQAFRKILMGKGGLTGRWVKELIYNIFIQSVHAAFYASLIGLTIRLSDDLLSFIGAILTIILFGFIFKLDGIIRKLFNFVGGKDTVKVVDYESILKHPVDSFKQGQNYFSGKMEELSQIPQNISDKMESGEFSNNLVKFKNNLVTGIKDTVDSLDGKNIKVSEEEIEKEKQREKEKLENPSVPAKILAGIKGFTFNTVGLGKIAIENISKKTKEELFRLKSFAHKETEKLKQNSEMLKKIGRIISHKAKLKLKKKIKKEEIEKNTPEVNENEKREAAIEDKKETVLNLNSTPEEDIGNIRHQIELSKGDIPAIVFAVQGPQAFIYQEAGSPHMGMSILASERYERRIYRPEIKSEERRNISAPNIIQLQTRKREQEIGNQEEVLGEGFNRRVRNSNIISIEEARKKYKFKRFNSASVRTITRAMTRRYVINDNYLSCLAAVGQNIESGSIVVNGSFPYRINGLPQIRKSKIKYTAKLKGHTHLGLHHDIVLGMPEGVKEKDISAPSNAEPNIGRRGKIVARPTPENSVNKIISFSTMAQRKVQAEQTVSNFHEKMQDVNWAVLTSISDDIQEIHEESIESGVKEVTEAEAVEVVIKQLEDMGKAVNINSEVTVVFGQDIEQVVDRQEEKFEEVGETVVQEAAEVSSTVQEKTTEKSTITFESRKKASVEQLLGEVKVASNERKVAETVGVNFKFQHTNSEQVLESITDRVIVETAIKFDTPLDRVSFQDDEVKSSVVDELINRGVVSFKVKDDVQAVGDLISVIEDRRDVIVTEKKDEYAQAIMESELARIIEETASQVEETEEAKEVEDINFIGQVDSVQTEDVLSSRIDANIDTNISSHYDKLSKVLQEVAIDAIREEAESVKIELKTQAQSLLDAILEAPEVHEEEEEVVEEALEGEELKEKIEAVVNKTKKKAKAVILPGKESQDNQEGQKDTRETYIIYVMGAVIFEGRYELPAGSRIYEAIKAAGGPTDDADLTAIPYYDFIYNGETIYIPKRSDDDIEETFKKCRPVVAKFIKDYMIEEEISQVETLRKLVHRNILVNRLQRALREEQITKNQIQGLIEERIKELIFIREGLKKAKGKMKVVKKSKVKVQETDEIKAERERQQRAIKNSAEASLDEAIRNLNSFDANKKENEEANDRMNDLLKQLDSQREKVLVNTNDREKRQARLRYIDETPDNMMNKLLGRV